MIYHCRYRLAVVAVLFCLVASPARAQILRLPPTDIKPAGDAVRLAQRPDSSSDILPLPGEESPALMELDQEPDLPPGVRNGVFQKLIFDGGYLARGGGAKGLGGAEISLKAIFGLPCPTRKSPLVITPGFAVRYIDGPVSPDLPPRVYDAYMQFRWLTQATPRLGIDLAITPGVYSDFETSIDEAFRLTGHAAAAWTCSPTLKLVLGAAYINRLDVDVIPIGGLLWTPHEAIKIEALFPRPRIATRFLYLGEIEYWSYLAGEFGGETWAVRRADGSDDVLNYRDWRIILGVERKSVQCLNSRLEVAYVFGREVQFQSATPDFVPHGTVMVRGGLTY
jgi:hypothetical protein